MNVPVRFEDEADAEYRAAGRWYEARRVGLGLEFLGEVDAAIDQERRAHAERDVQRGDEAQIQPVRPAQDEPFAEGVTDDVGKST